MPLIRRVIAFHIVFLGFGWALWTGSGGSIGMYIDIPSGILVGVILIGCALFCFSPAEITDAARAVSGGPGEADKPQRRRRVSVAAQAYQVAWGAGIVGTLTGLIAMLANLSDPAAIGKGMSVALLSTLYGAFLAEFVAGPCRQALLNQLDDPRNPDGEPAEVAPATGSASGLWRGAAVVLHAVLLFRVDRELLRTRPTYSTGRPHRHGRRGCP